MNLCIRMHCILDTPLSEMKKMKKGKKILLLLQLLQITGSIEILVSSRSKHAITMTKIYQSAIVSTIYILLLYTQHLKYIFKIFNMFKFKVLFIFMLRWVNHTFVENRE